MLDEEEEQLHDVVLELWPIGEMALEESYFLKEIHYGMLQSKEKLEYLVYFYQHQLREVLILDEIANVTVKDKKITRWIVTTEEQLNKLNLGSERDPKQVLINAVLLIFFQAQIKEILVNYHDVFAWNYKDLKGIGKEICEHKIELVANAQPIKQRQYIMTPNYALTVRKNLDKLFDAKFIYPIETTQWLSFLVIVPVKNGKLRICVNYHKLNAQTKKDPFPLHFLDFVLDSIAQHEIYSFMDGYNGYNLVKMVEKDKYKTTFISEWGAYAYKVMPSGLCNALATFQKVVTKMFKPYLNKFV